jgi:hypothetical protein
MSKVTKHTDLTQSEGDPTSRADADLPIEDFKIRVSTPRWPGIEIKTHTAPRSPLGNAVAAVLLILAGGLCLVLLHWIGAPHWAQLGGLFLPWAFCLTLRPASRSRAAPQPRR